MTDTRLKAAGGLIPTEGAWVMMSSAAQKHWSTGSGIRPPSYTAHNVLMYVGNEQNTCNPHIEYDSLLSHCIMLSDTLCIA